MIGKIISYIIYFSLLYRPVINVITGMYDFIEYEQFIRVKEVDFFVSFIFIILFALFIYAGYFLNKALKH